MTPTIEKLKRIMWRLREKNTGSDYKTSDIHKAVLYEVGGDKRTKEKYIALLVEADLIKRMNRYIYRDIGGVL